VLDLIERTIGGLGGGKVINGEVVDDDAKKLGCQRRSKSTALAGLKLHHLA
jgi:hypothetical protein